MELSLQIKLKENPKYYQFLKENSQWIKDLNRNSLNYSKFENEMKKQYKIRTTDKLNEVIDNIDLISTIISSLK